MALVLTPRSVGLMVAAAVAAGWLGASIAQGPVAEQSSRGAGPRPIGSPAPVPRAEILRERLSEPPLPSRGRNPFVYGARAPRSTTSFRDRPEPPVEAPALPVVEALPPMPVFKLSGIASSAEGGVNVLTAILNDNGAMVFAKAGDKLSNGYSVVRVEETSVTLSDASGITQTIRLP
jgi:hypothetical protein